MTAEEGKVLDFINKVVREEKGNRVTIDSTLRDTELDSFGYTALMLDLDDEYGYFDDIPDDVDVFTTVEWDKLTIRDVIEKCINK